MTEIERVIVIKTEIVIAVMIARRARQAAARTRRKIGKKRTVSHGAAERKAKAIKSRPRTKMTVVRDVTKRAVRRKIGTESDQVVEIATRIRNAQPRMINSRLKR